MALFSMECGPGKIAGICTEVVLESTSTFSRFPRQYRVDEPILIPLIITFFSNKTRESSSRKEYKLLAFRYARFSK